MEGPVAKRFCHYPCPNCGISRLVWSRMAQRHFMAYWDWRAGEISRNQSWPSWVVLSAALEDGAHLPQSLQTGEQVLEFAWLHAARWPAKEPDRYQLRSPWHRLK